MPSYPSAFYVYLLVDPRTGVPFYCGKGQRNRAWQHAVAVAKGDLSGNARKVAKIQEILMRGGEVEIQIVGEYDLENDALEHEFELVDSMPTLTNIMPGGCPGPGGRCLTAEEIHQRVLDRRRRIEDRAKFIFLQRNRSAQKTERQKAFQIPNAHLHQNALETWFSRHEDEMPCESSLGFQKRRNGRISAYNLAASHRRKKPVPDLLRKVWDQQGDSAASLDLEKIRQQPVLSSRQKQILAEGPGPMGMRSSKK